MGEVKTKQTGANVFEFIQAFASSERKVAESIELVHWMEKVTGYPATMWGPSIIGFGKYHYRSEKSKQHGDWPLVGFSPRKAAFSLYVYASCDGQQEILTRLGKFTMGKACIYVKSLRDIDWGVLQELVESSIKCTQEKYGIAD